MGDYQVKSNTLTSGRPPQFSVRGISNGSIEMVHSEFLGDISSSIAFASTVYPINAGLYASNPFLSLIANNFEQYEFLGLVYQFKSTSASALSSTNTALGTIMMATNYDVLDAPFANKQQMEAYMFSTSCAPSEHMLHPVECDPKQNALANLYCRSGSIPSGSDQRFYDMGNLQISTVGSQAAAVIGEIWVSYHVRLLKPKLPTPLGANLLCAHFASNVTSTTSTAAAPFGSGPVTRAGSTYPATVVNSAATPLTMPVVGRFIITISATGTAIGSAANWTVFGANIVPVTVLGNNTLSQEYGLTSTTSSACVVVVDVVLPGTTSANVMSSAGFSGMASGAVDLFVTQISSGLVLSGEEILQLRLDALEKRLSQDEEKESLSSDFTYLSVSDLADLRSRPRLTPPINTTSALSRSSIPRGLNPLK
jgi:hypothetical protein